MCLWAPAKQWVASLISGTFPIWMGAFSHIHLTLSTGLTKIRYFAEDIFNCIFFKENVFWHKFRWNVSLEVQLKINIGSCNGLMPHRWQISHFISKSVVTLLLTHMCPGLNVLKATSIRGGHLQVASANHALVLLRCTRSPGDHLPASAGAQSTAGRHGTLTYPYDHSQPGHEDQRGPSEW